MNINICRRESLLFLTETVNNTEYKYKRVLVQCRSNLQNINKRSYLF